MSKYSKKNLDNSTLCHLIFSKSSKFTADEHSKLMNETEKYDEK